MRPRSRPTRAARAPCRGSSRRPAAGRRVCGMVAALEPRRLLAAVEGTEGPDVIEGRIDNESDTAFQAGVIVNGTLLGTLTSRLDPLTIDARGGNDLIVIEQETHLPFPPARGLDIAVNGGAGNDTLLVDDDLNEGVGSYHFRPNILAYAFRFASGLNTYHYNDTLENLTLDQNGRDTTTVIDDKRASLNLTVNGMGGDDAFWVGGVPAGVFTDGTRGDLDSDGMDNVTVTGGAGEDRIVFDDAEDVPASGESETLVLDTFTAAKGDSVVTYSAFEVQTIHTAGGRVDGQAPVHSTVNFNGASGFVDSTVIVAGGRPTTVNVGNGNLLNLSESVRVERSIFDGGTAIDVNVDHSTATSAVTWDVYETRLVNAGNGQSVEFVGVSSVQLRAGTGGDSINVRGATPKRSLDVYAGGGNDRVNVGVGRVADLRGWLTVDGGAGADEVVFGNNADPDPARGVDVTVEADVFALPGRAAFRYAAMERVVVAHGAGGSRTFVRSLAAPLSLLGGGGDDLLMAGSGDANFPAAGVGSPLLSFDGGAGADSAELTFQLYAGDPLSVAEHTFDVNSIDIGIGFPLRFDRYRQRDGALELSFESMGVERRVLHAGDARDVVRVLNPGSSAVRVNTNGGDDDVSVADTVAPTLPVEVDTGGGRDHLDVNSDSGTAGDLPAVVVLGRSDGLASANVRSGGTLRVGPGAVLTREASAAGGTFLLNGVIDLAGGAFVYQQGAPLIDGLTALVKWGGNGGAWNGSSSLNPDGTSSGAIHSSLAASTSLRDAVGLAPASALFRRGPASFLGQPVGAGDVVFRYTLEGDADLDGRVTSLDARRLRAALGRPNTRWDQGNFNYDGATDVADYLLQRRNLGRWV